MIEIEADDDGQEATPDRIFARRMIKQAFIDFHRALRHPEELEKLVHRGPGRPRKEKVEKKFTPAWWLIEDDSEDLQSLAGCCDVLGWDAKAVRERMAQVLKREMRNAGRG